MVFGQLAGGCCLAERRVAAGSGARSMNTNPNSARGFSNVSEQAAGVCLLPASAAANFKGAA